MKEDVPQHEPLRGNQIRCLRAAVVLRRDVQLETHHTTIHQGPTSILHMTGSQDKAEIIGSRSLG